MSGKTIEMASMKTDLGGLLSRASRSLEGTGNAYQAAGLDQLLEHLQGLAAGKHTLKEFCEFYCLDMGEQNGGPAAKDVTNGENE